jgi:cbb3-type cytochrome oxidase subunit 3
MLGSANLVYTALLTIFFLKKKYFSHHYSSIGVIVLGMCFIGVSYMLFKNSSGTSEEHSTTDVILGLVTL